jgi:hypothetical protein
MPASSLAENGKFATAPPGKIEDRALEELLSFQRQGNLLHGDIKKVALKYGLTYWSLYHQYHRTMAKLTGGAVERSIVTKPCASSSSGSGVDVHGWDCYTTEVPPQFSKMLPWVGKGNRGYWRIKTPDVTLNAFGSGKIMVFPHSLFWKQVLAVELRKYGWDGLILDSFFTTLHLNGETVHVAFSDPQCPSTPAVFENGLWKITYHRDKTPNPQGSAEITVTAQGLESAIATLQSEVGAIPERLKSYLGSVTVNQLLTQMMVHVEKLGNRLAVVESRGSVGNSVGNGVDTLPPPSIEEPPVVLITTSPDPVRCPHAKELSPGSWYCGPRTVFADGRARLNPLPCFRPGFEKCDHYG